MSRLAPAMLVLPACLLIEIILGGPFGIYGGIHVRTLLLAASCAWFLFALLLRGRVARAHVTPILSVAGFVVVNGIWVAVVPTLTGNDMHWALREPFAFVVLGLVVLVLAALTPSQLAATIPKLQRLVVATSLVLAVFQVALWVLGTMVSGIQRLVPLVLGAVLPSSSSQLYVGTMPDGFFRVFWISTLWCLLSFFWFPVAFPGVRFGWFWRGLLLMDLFVAYSRGLWVGLVAGMLVVFATTVTRAELGRRVIRAALAGGVGLAALIAVLTATGSLRRGAERVTSAASGRDPSIGARVEQAPFLLELWYEHPVIGSGYGAYAPGHLRSQESPYSYEHMPYALLAKLGLLGVLAGGTFLSGWGLAAWRARRQRPADAASFLGSCTALFIAEMTNPMILNFVSMTIFACLLVQWADMVRPYGLAQGPA